MSDTNRKRILVAPLNWGLGHATRCIPIINALIAHHFEPVLASDGNALKLLQKEYPKLKTIELPSYNITYAKKASGFKLKLLKDTPHLLKTIEREKKFTKGLIAQEGITGIISDNRFGVRNEKIPCVFVTHQLRVLSGSTTWFSSKVHQHIISKFDECWVPDYRGSKNLSGTLGHLKKNDQSIRYIGANSRFQKLNLKTKYDLMVLLSGPEPQRSYLEKRLLEKLKYYNGSVLFVKGVLACQQTEDTIGSLHIFNFMTSSELEIAINSSDLILSRSGYTTIMDLAKLNKKAFFIPTPGQYEQEYLAKKLDAEGIAPWANQNAFHIRLLEKVENYSGFDHAGNPPDYKNLFSLF